MKNILYSLFIFLVGCAPLSIEKLTVRAEKGIPDAQFELGQRYAAGIGTQKDMEKAAHWFSEAASADHLRAQFVLGRLYQFGEGVNQDYRKAMVLYTEAAKKDQPEAVNALGVMYDLGLGVGENNKVAVAYFMKGADLFYATSMLNLAMMYGQGEGVKRDLLAAYMWTETGLYFAHQAGGDMEAVPALIKLQKHIGNQLTQVEISNAKRGTAIWIESKRAKRTSRPPGTDPSREVTSDQTGK